jgi:uncharacterized phage protein (TIGR02218 family)
MRALPTAMTLAFLSGVTTHCRCLKITRADGVVKAFTDHDADVICSAVVTGSPVATTYSAADGHDASALETTLGLSIDNLSITGPLTPGSFTDSDIAAGLLDDSDWELWLVDWSNPSVFTLMRNGSLGQITRGRAKAEVELRGLSHRLNQPTARLATRTCWHTLGDSSCGVALAGYTDSGTVAVVDTSLTRQKFTASGMADTAGTKYFHGLVTFTTGQNAGLSGEVRYQTLASGITTITIALPLPYTISAGDSFSIVRGCDKTAPTCNGSFANIANFGGFPRMPGIDQVYFYGDTADLNNGASLFT